VTRAQGNSRRCIARGPAAGVGQWTAGISTPLPITVGLQRGPDRAVDSGIRPAAVTAAGLAERIRYGCGPDRSLLVNPDRVGMAG
jgi:hypothetical protein